MRKPSALRPAVLFWVCSLGFLAVARPVEISDAKLKELVGRSDFIIVAQTQTICGSFRGEGPFPDGIHPTPEYREFIFPVSIARILKGANAQSNPLLLSYTALVYGPKDPPPTMTGRFSFDVDPKKRGKEKPLEGAPTPGVSYIFFLQNRKVMELGSYEAAGTQEIVYDNFDYTCGMIPTGGGLLARINGLAKAK